MNSQEKSRRTELLEGARAIAQKAAAAGRDLTPAESMSIDSAISAARAITAEVEARREAEAKSAAVFADLDAMARGGQTVSDDLRLNFGAKSATAIATAMLGAGGGQKNLAPSGSTVTGVEFAPSPVALGKPAAGLLSVLPVKRHSSPAFSYLRANVRDNAAAVVAEFAAKPVSKYGVERIDATLSVLAHIAEPIPRYWILDNNSLEGFLTSEMSYGLTLAVEKLALAAILGTSGIQSNAKGASTLATLRKSLTKLEVAGETPDSFVLNPNDFEAVELLVSSTNAVEHLSLPFDPVARRLFGVPVAVTNAIDAGTALTLAKGSAAIDTDEFGVQTLWSETSGTDLEHNLCRVRMEMRAACSTYRPLGVVKSVLA
jgi:HK97 family phage major capsid protein